MSFEVSCSRVVGQWNSSGFSSQDSTRCSSVKKSNVYCWDQMRHQRISQEESYLFRCSMIFLVDQKTMNKNAWRMPNSFLFLQRDMEKDNGHLLVLVLNRSGTVSVKTVHKEFGTMWLKGCWLNSQKADVQFSALRAPYPEVASEAKDMETCRYTMQPITKQLSYFSHNCLCKPAQFLRSNRRDVKSMKPFMRENEDPTWWGNRVPHSRWVWSRQKYFRIVMTQPIKIFYCSSMENELKSCHNKTNWANFVWI